MIKKIECSRPSQSIKTQKGLTLVELMLSATLGLLLILGVTRIMMMTNNSARLNDGMSEIQETGRFLMGYIGNYIKEAGYQVPGEPSINEPVLICANDWCTQSSDNNADPLLTSPNTQCVGVDDNADINIPVGDRLSIVSNPDSNEDCTGATAGINDNDRIANVFWVDGTNNLRCRGYNLTDNNWVANSSPIAEGVQSMQVLLGESTNPAGQNDKSVNRYVGPGEATLDSSRIYAVKLGLIIRTSDLITTMEQRTRTYGLFDSNVFQPNDRCNRQVFTSSFVIANANQSEE